MTKILLVEDDKSLREIYGVRLLAEGYDIVSAGDGEEALAMAIKDRPDLIVSDVMMPKISGFDMLDILRSTTETKNIKVIMMTALSSEEQRQRGVSLGADRYLVKSQVGIEDVVRSVHEVLADAPVSGQPPLVSTPAPAPVAAPQVAPVAPAVPNVPPRMPTPVDPTPAATPVAPVAAAPQPAPITVPPATPVQPATPSPAPTTLPQSVLPEPSAPFSTPRPTPSASLSERVIQPLETSSSPAPDFANLINQELSEPAAAPTGSIGSSGPGIEFEETPLPAASGPAAPAVTLPPTPPTPNAGV
jgi:CheY-like chemotaxis protein